MYLYLWYFFIYAVLGWCTEVAYVAVCEGKFVNRGFLNGPYCPIYGCGAAAVLALLTPVAKRPLLLFIGSVLVTSAIEFLVGFLLEKLFHEKWWDYSNEPFNIKGYICPKFSLMWGIACLLGISVIHPPIRKLILMIPRTPGIVLLCFLYALMAADLVVTLNDVLRVRRHIRTLQKTAEELHHLSDKMGSHISEGVLGAVKLQERAGQEYRKTQERMEQLRERIRRERALLPRLTRHRLLKAFPQLRKKLEQWEQTEKNHTGQK